MKKPHQFIKTFGPFEIASCGEIWYISAFGYFLYRQVGKKRSFSIVRQSPN